MKLIACFLLLCGCPVAFGQSGAGETTLSAQVSEPDSRLPDQHSGADFLIISGEFDHFTAASGGGSASLDWVRRTDEGRTFALGIASCSIGNSRWTLARSSIALHAWERIVLDAGVSVGPGKTNNSDFLFALANAGLSYKTSPRLYLKASDQYLHVSQIQGHLLRTGALLVPLRQLSAGLTYGRSIGGTLNSEYVSLSGDIGLRRIRLLTSAASGHSTPGVFDVSVGIRAPHGDLREGSLGVRIPISRAEMTPAIEFLNVGPVRRRTLTMSLKFPLPTAQ